MLRPLLAVDDPRVLVDASSFDDAAVYRIAPDRALVATADFFTPIVDDPGDFGRIAAANALSDVYAMGARPLFVLNLLAFPRDLLGEGMAEEVVRGGAQKAAEAGVPVLGGHSIDDPEPKYGMVAVGEVAPDAMLTNAGARPGDRIVLTKPLGSGIAATAIKKGACPARTETEAVDVMSRLNRNASEAALAAGARAATDVTGYGLAGHLRNMARASGAAARVEAARAPAFDGIAELVADGHVPGGTRRNMAEAADWVSYGPGVSETTKILLSDAQTSGGLLVACPPGRAREMLTALEAKGEPATAIGEFTEGPAGTIAFV